MKKTFLLVVLMSLIGFNYVAAQSSLIATLSHENDVKEFYGTDAFKNAHAAAVNGDVITLSSGSFAATDITKAVTIRGAGVTNDFENGYEQTIVKGTSSIKNVNDSIHSLTIEGIYIQDKLYYSGNNKNIRIVKCNLHSFDEPTYNYNGETINNTMFINCRIYNDLCVHDNSGVVVLNSVIDNPRIREKSIGSEFVNCVIYTITGINKSLLKNCYIRQSGYRLTSLNEAYNCVGSNAIIFEYMSNSTNKVCAEADMFKTEGLYVLTDAAKAEYIGTDGTEVGIYGGNMPYDVTSDFPRILKCNVASKSTIDGKLSVDIQVKTGK